MAEPIFDRTASEDGAPSLKCPWCGVESRDLWEVGDGEEGVFEHECGDCGKAMWLERCVSVDYYATPKAGV